MPDLNERYAMIQRICGVFVLARTARTYVEFRTVVARTGTPTVPVHSAYYTQCTVQCLSMQYAYQVLTLYSGSPFTEYCTTATVRCSRQSTRYSQNPVCTSSLTVLDKEHSTWYWYWTKPQVTVHQPPPRVERTFQHQKSHSRHNCSATLLSDQSGTSPRYQ